MAGHCVRITDTTLRDAHQSLWATRMRTEDMVPILETIDKVGYHSLEVWGGATFDVCLRFLGEDPWERLRTIRRYVRHTPLQMLLRGQNLLGYKHYPDDIVERFIAKAVENGIDIIRIFDALNDVENLKFPIKIAKREGAHVQGSVVYTVSPVHTLERYVETAERLAEMGADSICIKDMAGLLQPYVAYELVRALKARLDLPVQLHSHYIGGYSLMAYLKGIEAGADAVDTATAPLAFGSSQPAVETLEGTLRDTPYDPKLNFDYLFEIADYFDEVRKRYGFERGVTRISDMKVFSHQVPGGMISNLVSQLEQQRAGHRLQEVLEEIPRVRAELGYPPLVTPTSQIVGIQAVFNVLTGERYKVVPDEVRQYVRGFYGRPPGEIDPDLQNRLAGDSEIITCRPADLLSPGWEKAKAEIADLATSDEDVLSYALFPEITKQFLSASHKDSKAAQEAAAAVSGQNKGLKGAPPSKWQGIKEILTTLKDTSIGEFRYQASGCSILVRQSSVYQQLAGAEVPAQPQMMEVPVSFDEPAVYTADVRTTSLKPAAEPADLYTVKSPMVGVFYRAAGPGQPPYVDVGSAVVEGDTICIIEAMKLMNEITAEVDGIVEEILVDDGTPVEYGQPLFTIRIVEVEGAMASR